MKIRIEEGYKGEYDRRISIEQDGPESMLERFLIIKLVMENELEIKKAREYDRFLFKEALSEILEGRPLVDVAAETHLDMVFARKLDALLEKIKAGDRLGEITIQQKKVFLNGEEITLMEAFKLADLY